MKVIIKIGGTLLDESSSRSAIARQLAETARQFELVVVHGGGQQVSRFLEDRGISSRFVDGLRVSGEPVIDAVLKVIAGSVNKQLVSAIVAAGESAVGLSGIDGRLIPAVQLDPDLAWVGKPVKTDPRLLDLLVNAGYLPVIACVSGDEHGHIYNVNADQIAASCAAAWQASKLLFLTDVSGVKNAEGRLLPHLTPGAVAALVESGVAHSGMRAKLEAAMTALHAGIPEVMIAPGREPNICGRLLAGERLGTRLSFDPVASSGVAV
jgi:acetylglutamate kinase